MHISVFSTCSRQIGTKALVERLHSYSQTITDFTLGTKQTESNNYLEKKIKKNSMMEDKEVIQTAIAALSHVLAVDFKPSEIEIAFVSKSQPAYQ